MKSRRETRMFFQWDLAKDIQHGRLCGFKKIKEFEVQDGYVVKDHVLLRSFSL